MYNNGVSHKTEPHDLDGIYTILKWLSYIPKDKYSIVPIVSPGDHIDREISYMPTEAPYDPRYEKKKKKIEKVFLPKLTKEVKSNFL